MSPYWHTDPTDGSTTFLARAERTGTHIERRLYFGRFGRAVDSTLRRKNRFPCAAWGDGHIRDWTEHRVQCIHIFPVTRAWATVGSPAMNYAVSGLRFVGFPRPRLGGHPWRRLQAVDDSEDVRSREFNKAQQPSTSLPDLLETESPENGLFRRAP